MRRRTKQSRKLASYIALRTAIMRTAVVRTSGFCRRDALRELIADQSIDASVKAVSGDFIDTVFVDMVTDGFLLKPSRDKYVLGNKQA